MLKFPVSTISSRTLKLSEGTTVGFCAALLLATACGGDMAPRELLDARDAYNKAQAGTASQFALAELETAKQALQKAETAFEDGEEQETKDLAYLAERKSQLAHAAGDFHKANEDRQAALKAREDARESYQKMTERKLSNAQRALEETARQKEEARKQAQMTEAELAAEKQRRLDAEKKAAAALASLEQLAKVKEEARGMVITLSGGVLFETGASTLMSMAMTKLDDVARALKDQGYKKITVEGHTDSRGSDSVNLELSRMRAEAVRSHLVSRGIESDKISAVGIGEARPVASNNTTEGRANNRRVEIIVEPDR